MLYVTGDVHGDAGELLHRAAGLRAQDALIVCGDFGLVWRGTRRERLHLDWINTRLRCPVLFLDGNHENFDLLEKYPVSGWQGGLVHRIRPKILHLMRGQVFEVAGRTLFVMGGAASHDMPDGVLDPRDPEFARKRQELAMGLRSLQRQDWRVDIVLTHCLPTAIQQSFGSEFYLPDRLTDYLDTVRRRCEFGWWYCGHYHHERVYARKFQVLYQSVVPLR